MVTRHQLKLLRSLVSFPDSASRYVVGRPYLCSCCLRDRLSHGTRLASNGSSSSSRPFTTSQCLLKKGKSPKDTPVPDNQRQRKEDAEIDPYDYSELHAGIDKAIIRLKDALTRTRSAGRISSDMIENLMVEINVKNEPGHSGQSRKESGRLSEYATVVPKGGRLMQVYVSEEAHIKPISSAIQASSHSLTPQPDAQNPLLVNVPIPPATAESRQEAVAEAKKSMERASLEVRTARGDAQKRFRKMELGRKVIKDELMKAHAGMEDVSKKGQDEVKKVYEQAVKSLER